MSEDSYHLGVKALIRDKRGRVLMLRLDSGVMGGELWDIPGGRVQRGHSIEETLKREILEEAGLHDVVIGEHLGMVLSPLRLKVGDSDVGLILSVYQCDIPDDAVIRPSDGHVAYEYVVPYVAAERLADKYPVEFCELISKL